MNTLIQDWGNNLFEGEESTKIRKILVVLGTRPEAIKMGPVIVELRKYPGDFQCIVCVTGQHTTMLEQALRTFEITADFDLEVMEENQALPSLTSSVLQKVGEVLAQVQPSVMLVQGDTTTAMAASFSAFYSRIPVGHVEAGLRTYNMYSPYPEEMNRRLIAALASYHFAPTQTAVNALRAEGIPEQRIYLTGNPVIDALRATLQKSCVLPIMVPNGRRLILVTGHRRENFGQPIENVCLALKDLACRNPDVEIVYPVHLNPNIQEPVYRLLGEVERIHLVSPLAYDEHVHLMNRAYLVLTDSGGIQEEAPALGKPVLVFRQETERPEAVEAGGVRVVGTSRKRLVDETEKLLNDKGYYERMARCVSPYGDGHAAGRIVSILRDHLRPLASVI